MPAAGGDGHDLPQHPAHGLDGASGPGRLLLDGAPLLRNDQPAEAAEGQGELRQRREARHGPGGDQIEGLPQPVLAAQGLRPAGEHLHAGQPQGIDEVAQEGRLLGCSLDEGGPEPGEGYLQRQPRKARAAADVEETGPLPDRSREGQGHAQGVAKVPPPDALHVGHGRSG